MRSKVQANQRFQNPSSPGGVGRFYDGHKYLAGTLSHSAEMEVKNPVVTERDYAVL
jgi:hypothetical protein